MIERDQIHVLTSRLQEPRRFIQVIMGPRQTGKTTLAHQMLEKISAPGIYHSADSIPAGNIQWLEQIWEAARIKLKTSLSLEMVLVIDEIQKISGWSESVKKLWDEDSKNKIPLKVVLLGSSRLLLQSGLTESLAGRFEVIYMGHWSLKEMQDAFGWSAEEYAWFGGYPGSAGLHKDEQRWKLYIQNSLIESSISKDILMLSRIDKPALLRQLFELGCLYSGQVLSLTKIQGQLQDSGNTTTLSHYLQLLHSAGLLGGIDKYAADIIRKKASLPKFQVHNNALLSSQSNSDFNEIIQQPSEWGRVIESAVGAHLINGSFFTGLSVYYWRERDKEVDFVLEHKGRLMAIEVKSNTSYSKKGTQAFRELYPRAKILLVGKAGLPWEDFLAVPPIDLF